MEHPETPNNLLVEIAQFKYPTDFAGQKLFIKGEDYSNNAMLGLTHFPWDIYAAGYKDAANALVKAVMERQASLDSVIYPLVFIYRQAIELQLKIILPVARRLNGDPEKADHGHGLRHLWYDLKKLLKEISPEYKDKNIAVMQDFIMQLDVIDPASIAFRYPKGKEGNDTLPDLRYINVRHLSEIMNSMFLWFDGVYSQFSEWDQNHDYY